MKQKSVSKYLFVAFGIALVILVVWFGFSIMRVWFGWGIWSSGNPL